MKKLLLSLMMVLICSPVFGATNNWQGDDLTNPTYWNDADNWSDGVPTADDDVVIAGSNALNINAAAVCRSFNASAYTGTITHNAAVALTIGDATAGAGNVALAFNSGMTYTLGNGTTSALSFQSSSATQQTIDFAGKNTGNVTFGATAVSGNYQLTGTWGTSSVNAGQAMSIVKGALDTNSNNIHIGSLTMSSNNTKSLTAGTSTINLYYAGSGGNIVYIIARETTLSMASATLNFAASTYSEYGLRTGINITIGTVNIAGAGVFRITSDAGYSITIGTLNRTGTAVKTDGINFADTGTTVITGTLNLDGNSSINRLLIYSNTLGIAKPLTVTGATVTNSTNVDFRDIAFVSTGAVDFSGITGGSGDCGGNTISGGGTLTFTTADDWYWYNAGAGTYNWSDYSHWYDTTGGGGTQMASTRTILPQDNAYINADSVNGATTIDQDLPRMGKTIDFTGTDAVAWHINNISQTLYGGLILSSSVTPTSTNNGLTFEGRSANNLSIPVLLNPNSGFNMVGGSMTLIGNVYFGRVTTLGYGTLDMDVYNFNTNTFTGSGSGTRSLYLGSGTHSVDKSDGSPWDMTTTTNLTFDSESSTILILNMRNDTGYFIGGGLSYNNLTINSFTNEAKIFGSNTFNTLTINAPKTVKFTSGTTQTVNSFVVVNNGTNRTVLSSTTADSVATISDANGGTNENDYLDVVDVNATQENTFYYGANGTEDNSANWYDAPASGGIAVSTVIRLDGVAISGIKFN